MGMDVSTLSNADKLGEVLRRALPLLPQEARREIEKVLTPEGIAVMAAVLVAWVAAHFFGVGELIDIVLTVAGVFAIGMAVFEGIEHLWTFAESTYQARTDAELDRAARHLADAVAIIGIQAALAILFKRRSRTYGGKPIRIIPQPSRPPDQWFARPGLKSTGWFPAGQGGTTEWGDIIISRFGTPTDRRLAAIHESVHRFLTPTFRVLRNFRVRSRARSYERSALVKYIEEALAETVAQVGVNGARATFRGISFPVQGRYVTVLRADGKLRPFAPEAGGLLAGGFLVAGMVIEIWDTAGPPQQDMSVP